MKKTLLFLIALLGMVSVAQAQIASKDIIGTWEGAETMFARYYNMEITYSKIRMVITQDRLTFTEWTHGSKELPGVGLNIKLNLREDMILGYVLDGDEMRITKYYQNPLIKFEKYEMGGDQNMINLLKQQGVTAKTYVPTMEQSMNSTAALFEMVGFLIKRLTPTEIELSKDGAIDFKLKKVANTKKESAPQATQASAKKTEKAAEKVEKEAEKTEKEVVKEAEKEVVEEIQEEKQPVVEETKEIVNETEESQPVVEQNNTIVKEEAVVVKEEKKEKEEEKKEEKAWYSEAWETILSWF